MDALRQFTYKIFTIFALMVLSVAEISCLSGPAGTSVRYDNVQFMDLCGTYTRCVSTEDIASAALDSARLQAVSEDQVTKSPVEEFFPAPFKHVIAQPSSRLAVDVHAMAASCNLHTGILALSFQEHDLARKQFMQILNSPTQSEYSYYATQALTGLSHLELTLQASLR